VVISQLGGASMLSQLREGQTFKGYQILRKLNEGGMGEIWLAHQVNVKRDVAIKFIKPERANEPEFIRRFELEAELVARLEHPYIVPLYDFWREPDGAFLIMRYLRGGSLYEVFQTGAQPPQTVLHWLEQIASALSLAHQEHIIHRDIKPGNILLDDANSAYLADFGLAQHVDSESNLEASGSMGYASPEQLMGEATASSDLFSLGLVLYELLTGTKAFGGHDWLQRLMHEPLPRLSDTVTSLSDELDDVIQKATRKSPHERYTSAHDLLMAFKQAVSGNSPIVVHDTPEDLYAIALTAPNPYRGLQAFQEVDAANFFGRHTLVERLITRLNQPEQEARFLAVVGPSGSGKSSLVRAGLIPALRQGSISGSEHWFILDVFPGDRPFQQLEAELLRVAVNPPPTLLEQLTGEDGIGRAVKRVLPHDKQVELLLVIDQFEELFTLTPKAQRIAFLDALVNAISDPHSRLRVVVTLRADFYDRPLNYRILGDLLRKRTEVILPFSTDELRDAIVLPAENTGAQFEEGLVEQIAREIDGETGMLPLLQYALTELYEQRKGQMLTHAAYESFGGVAGALSRRAEETYAQFDHAHQETVKQVFLRLIALGEGTEDTRRRVWQHELSSIPRYQAIIDAYGMARLLTFDRDAESREPTVEITHEALIRNWQRLQDWMHDNRDEMRVQRRLTREAEEWQQANHDPGLLATGTRLIQYQTFVDTTNLIINDDERKYLDASFERQSAEVSRLERLIETANSASTQAQKNRRRALGAGIVAIIITLLAGILSTTALQQRADAEQGASTANAQVAIAGQTLTPIPPTLTRAANIVQDSTIQREISNVRAQAIIDVHLYDSAMAVANMNNLIALYPDEPEAYASRGYIYIMLESDADVVANYSQAIALDPNYAEYYIRRASAYQNLGEYQSALDDYDMAQSLEQDNEWLYTSRAFLHTELAQYDQALADLNRAVTLNPNDVTVYQLRGMVYGLLGQYDDALTEFDRALEIDPDNASVFELRGLVYHEIEQYDLALVDYTRALELNPRNAGVFAKRGEVYKDLEDYEQAIDDLSQAIALNPSDSPYYYERAHTYTFTEQFDLALADLNRFLEIEPQSVRGYYLRANIHAQQDDNASAIADYTRVIDLNPDYLDAYYMRGQIYYFTGQYEDALSNFDDVTEKVEANPDLSARAEVYWFRGNTYLNLEQYDRAIDDYSQGILLEPDNSALRWGRGNSYHALGDTAQAIADFREYERITGTLEPFMVDIITQYQADS
jgi:tetratricopeptide (TPR) repeat protein/energy-coupling factor transporter ATP-binding protein EcfA2